MCTSLTTCRLSCRTQWNLPHKTLRSTKRASMNLACHTTCTNPTPRELYNPTTQPQGGQRTIIFRRWYETYQVNNTAFTPRHPGCRGVYETYQVILPSPRHPGCRGARVYGLRTAYGHARLRVSTSPKGSAKKKGTGHRKIHDRPKPCNVIYFHPHPPLCTTNDCNTIYLHPRPSSSLPARCQN